MIDAKIKELGDWRWKTLAKVRAIIHQADPEILEAWRWVNATNPGTPVWSHGGLVYTGDTYKNVVLFGALDFVVRNQFPSRYQRNPWRCSSSTFLSRASVRARR